MSTLFSLLLCFILPFLVPTFIYSSPVQDPQLIVQQVHGSITNATRRSLGYLSCGFGNPIDDCWRCDPHWANNCQRLADCAIGFGKGAIGGRGGKTYTVTDPTDDPINPKPGTLRYGAIQNEPLWIIFSGDVKIRLEQELTVNSFKKIDGRGSDVHIADGPCITIQHATNIIIHGLNIHGCKRGGDADGDGISIFGATHVWIDHCSLSRCSDGLIDGDYYIQQPYVPA